MIENPEETEWESSHLTGLFHTQIEENTLQSCVFFARRFPMGGTSWIARARLGTFLH